MTFAIGTSSPYINRFLQPDSIIPDRAGSQGWNRYAYVTNNPLSYIDPSGHDPWWCTTATCVTEWVNTQSENAKVMAEWYKLDSLIPKPSDQCEGDCYDSYSTYRSLVHQLGRVPSMDEILYMTAETEYTGYAGTEGFGQEGLARTYYSACYVKDHVNGCQGDEFYNFLAAYEPWSDRSGTVNNKKSPFARGQHLLKTLDSNKDWLWTDVRQITNFNIANSNGWTKGREGPEPWQWFTLIPSKNCSRRVKPSVNIDVGKGFHFWMLTFDETNAFHAYCP